PLQGAEALPPADDVWVHGAPRGPLVGTEEAVTLAEAADGMVDAEAPGFDAQPSQVLHRITDVGELPVEHGAQAVGPDDQVAVAEVAMDDGRSGGRRPSLFEPAQRQLERGVRLAEAVEHRPPSDDGIGLGDQ